VIIIFRFELDKHPDVAHQVTNLSQETVQIGNACAYIPKSGKVDELFSLLQKHKVIFSLHQSNGLEKRQIYEN
jgi:hypothetical protein